MKSATSRSLLVSGCRGEFENGEEITDVGESGGGGSSGMEEQGKSRE